MKNVEDIYVVSPLQQGLIFESLYSPGTGAYFVQVMGQMKGNLDHDALRRAWQRVVERHTILRTCFLWEDVDEVLQVVRREVKLPWQEFDWRGLSAGEQEAQLEILLKEDRMRGFDLTRAPLMRVTLIRLADRAYKFIWSHHHVLVDGWSGFLIFKEVFDLYGAFSAGRELPLPPPRPFRDYIAWLQQQDLAEAERFWRRRLKGFTNSTPLTKDRRASNGNGGNWKPDVQMLNLSEETTTALKTLARRHELTLNTLVQGAWALVLGCYSRERDLVFGTVVSGRPADLSGVESMVGLFINLLPMRVRLDGDAALLDWLKGLQSDQTEARVYEYSPLAQVQGWSEVPRGVPLFESIMAFENYPVDSSLSAEEEEGLRVTELSSIENANYPLGFAVAPGAEMLLQLSYDHTLFDAETTTRMLGHVKNVLESFIANPRRRLNEISLLSEAERRTLLVDWNLTQTEYPSETCIHHLFEAQAERTPDNIALSFEGTQLTYRELNARANQLAHHLQTLGVGPEVLVGLCTERSPEMIVGLLGILKAGGAYLPLDPSYPMERLAFIIEDAQVPVMVVEERVSESLPSTWAQVVYIDADWEEIALQRETNVTSGAVSENAAYVIYTSGSTGKPKGALLQHRGVCNLMTAEVSTFEPGADARVLQFASLSFDASVFEMLIALFTGSTLCLAKRESIIPGAPLLETLRRERITHLVIPPSILGALPEEELPELGTIVVVGEACSAEVARRWAAGRRFFNGYGPTEISVCATIARYKGGDRRPSIGRPIINTRVYVLDEEMRPVAVGVAGELYVGGEGLGRGYLRRPSLTAERFVPDPFSGEQGARLYRTGDLVRYLPGGEIEFIERIDYQVKVHGFRIELGEIGAALSMHDAVREAVVIVREDVPGDKRLVGYVSTEPGLSVTTSELRRYVEKILPGYMIPSAFVLLDSLPLSPNGKIDRRALPPPGDARPSLDSHYDEPRTPVEQTLVEIWAQVLGVDKVGVNDNFFELGGDSILSIQIIARANRGGLRLTPKQLFDHPTVAGLAAMAGGEAGAKAEQGLVTGDAPLTPIQRLFFEWELAEPHHFNQAVMLKLKAGTDTALLKGAMEHLLTHHDALRMRYREENGSWRQFNAAEETLSWESVSLVHLTSAEQRTAAIEAHAAQVQTSLNLTAGPLLRAVHFELGEGEQDRLLIVIHHLCVDGVSWRILLEDLELAYGQSAAGRGVSLPEKTTSYKGWAEELVKAAQSAPLRDELSYWTGQPWEQAQGLPVDNASGGNLVSGARSIETALSSEETDALLRRVPEAYQTQINEVLLTALGRAMRKWGVDGKVVVEVEGHGREEIGGGGVDVTRTVGWFTSVYPVLIGGRGGEGIGEELKRVKEEMRGVPRRGMGYGVLRYLSEDAEVREQMRRVPKAEVSFNYLGQFDRVAESDGVVQGAEESTGRSQSEQSARAHLLNINGMVAKGRLELVWTYSEQLHRPETIESLARTYVEELREIITHCQTGLSVDAASTSASDGIGTQATRSSAVEDEAESSYPASPMQELMAVQSQEGAGAGFYIPQINCDLQGNLNPAAFEQAWRRVTERHEVLRTALKRNEANDLLQVVYSQPVLPFEHLDWRSLTEGERRERLRLFLEEDRARGFDLERAPLMRMTLIRLGETSYQFTWTHHHLLLDGWSGAILLKEVFAYYEAAHNGEELHLEPARPYRDYIQWLQRQDTTAAESYWRETLSGFTRPTPLNFGRAVVREEDETTHGYGEQELQLCEETTGALQMLARRHRLTLNSVMQGAWALLLSRYSGESDVVYGAVMSGRSADLEGVEAMVGLFINTLPVRVRVDGERSVAEWLQRLQMEQVEVRRYEYSPLSQVQRWSEVPDGVPLFESVMRFQNYPVDPSLTEGDAELSIPSAASVDHWHYALNLVVNLGARMALRITFDGQRFDGDTIREVLEELRDVLERMTISPKTHSVDDLFASAATG